ncbi:MAG: hypothetical protein HYV63_15680 [Candidatus Schekmanbacteria bacterium]|nr:hypothetical protein [Candidatus Schekmanbacteria bacterium]
MSRREIGKRRTSRGSVTSCGRPTRLAGILSLALAAAAAGAATAHALSPGTAAEVSAELNRFDTLPHYGDETLTPTSTPTPTATPTSAGSYRNVLVRDVDGDGRNEVLLGTGGDGGGHGFEIRRIVDATGEYELIFNYSRPDWTEVAPYAGDVDNDGDDEIVAAWVGLDGVSGGVSIFERQDSPFPGWFEVWSLPLWLPLGGTNVMIGDVNADGLNEIVVGEASESVSANGLHLIEHTGGNSYADTMIGAGRQFFGGRIYNADGASGNEIVTATRQPGNLPDGFQIYRCVGGAGAITCPMLPEVEVGGTSLTRLTTSNLDGAFLPEIVVTEGVEGVQEPKVYRWNGSEFLLVGAGWQGAFATGHPFTGNLSNDGCVELAMFSNGELTLWRWDGAAATKVWSNADLGDTAVFDPTASGRRLVVQDADNSGLKDLVAIPTGGGSVAGQLIVYRDPVLPPCGAASPTPTPTGTPPTPTATPTPTPTAVAGAPTNLRVIPAGPFVHLFWDLPASWAANPPTGYRVYRKSHPPDTADFAAIGETQATYARYFLDDLRNADRELAHDYTVTALYDSGESVPCNPVRNVRIWHATGALAQARRAPAPAPDGRADAEVVLPIALGSAGGLTLNAMDIWINYDPAALCPARIERSALAVGLQITDNIGATDTCSGLLKISVLSPDLENPITLSGLGRFLDAVFAVSPSVTEDIELPVTFKKFLSYIVVGDEIGELAMDLEDSSFVASDVHRLGDVDGDQDVTTADALLALMIAAGKMEPTALQSVSGDINRDQRMTAGDVVGIQRLAVGLSVNPPEGTARHVETAGDGYHIRAGKVVWRGESQVEVPLVLDDAAGVAAVQLEVGRTAPAALSLASITASPAFSQQSRELDGSITLSLSRAEALPAGPVELATLVFDVDPAAMAALGRLDIVIGSVAVYGQYAEDLSWNREVTAENGWVAGGASVPAGGVGSVVGLAALAAALLVPARSPRRRRTPGSVS